MRPMGKPVTRKVWRFQVQGPNAWQVLEKVNGGPLEDVKFFRMSRMTIAGQRGTDAAARHGRSARPRAVGAVRVVRRGARDDHRGGEGVRPRAGRVAGVLLEHARVGLDPVAAARDLHGRGAARVPRVADAVELRGGQRARGKLRLGRHRGLLPQPVRAGLRAVRAVRPRLPRTRGARGDRPRDAAQEGHAGVVERRRDGDLRIRLCARGRGLHAVRHPERQLRLLELRRRARPGRRRRRPLALHRVQRERAAGALARDGRPGGRDRHGAAGRLG